MHILLSVLHTFLMVLVGRICTNIKTFHVWRSFPLFLSPVYYFDLGLIKAKPQQQTSEKCWILCRPGSVKIVKTKVNNSKVILMARRLGN